MPQKPKVIALLSGGLDSILAVRILQRQNLFIEGLNIRTPFDFSQQSAVLAAKALDIPLTILRVDEDYVELLRHPRYGFGKGANPCLDCRIYMARLAYRTMCERGACAVVSGEVLGQRPMSQKRQDLDLIARRAGLEGRLLRPLSAQLLEPTIAEQEGLIDRTMLHGFSGRGRAPLIALAEQFGIKQIPTPSPGCALTEATFAPRVQDLLHFNSKATLWDCELLTIGRHFRIDLLHKLILGRNAENNERLALSAMSDEAINFILIEPENFIGPTALLCGPQGDRFLSLAVGLMITYTRQFSPNCQAAVVAIHRHGTKEVMQFDSHHAVHEAKGFRPVA